MWVARARVDPTSSIRLNFACFAAALVRCERGETSCRGSLCRVSPSRAYIKVTSRDANRNKRHDSRVRVPTHSSVESCHLPFVHRHAGAKGNWKESCETVSRDCFCACERRDEYAPIDSEISSSLCRKQMCKSYASI